MKSVQITASKKRMKGFDAMSDLEFVQSDQSDLSYSSDSDKELLKEEKQQILEQKEMMLMEKKIGNLLQ